MQRSPEDAVFHLRSGLSAFLLPRNAVLLMLLLLFFFGGCRLGCVDVTCSTVYAATCFTGGECGKHITNAQWDFYRDQKYERNTEKYLNGMIAG